LATESGERIEPESLPQAIGRIYDAATPPLPPLAIRMINII